MTRKAKRRANARPVSSNSDNLDNAASVAVSTSFISKENTRTTKNTAYQAEAARMTSSLRDIKYSLIVGAIVFALMIILYFIFR